MKSPSRKSQSIGIILLGAMGGAFIAAFVFALSHTRKAHSNDSEDAYVNADPNQSNIQSLHGSLTGNAKSAPLIPGKIELLKWGPDQGPTNGMSREWLVSGGKKIRFAFPYTSPGDRIALIKGPKEIRSGAFVATLTFPKYSPVQLSLNPTSDPETVAVRIPAQYPVGVDHAVLAIAQRGHVSGQWPLKGLPPTKEQWKVGTSSNHIKVGPVDIQVQAWRMGPETNGPIFFKYSGGPPNERSKPGEHWEIGRSTTIAPRYAVGAYPSDNATYLAYELPTSGSAETAENLAYASLQSHIRLKGEVVHYATYEEKVQFHGLTIREITAAMPRGLLGSDKGGEASRTMYVVEADSPVHATSASGIKVTLYPHKTGEPLSVLSSPPQLVLDYSLSCFEDYPIPLPGSPISKHGALPVLVELRSEIDSSTLRNRPPVDESLYSFRIHLRRYFDKNSKFGLTLRHGKCLSLSRELLGENRDLTLILRHRVDLDRHPYAISVPIGDAPPQQRQNLAIR